MGKRNRQAENKEKEAGIEMEGVVVEAVKGKFIISVSNGEADPHLITAYITGKLRKNFIKVVLGDRVKVEVSPYDFSKGRIVYRLK